MRISMFAAVAFTLSAAAALAAPPPPRPGFFLPTPPGWRTDTMTFPLPFAPALPYRAGIEEVRFAPGMFDAASPGFWTFGAVWAVDRDPGFDPARIAHETAEYFAGLATAGSRAGPAPPRAADLPARLAPAVGGGRLVGTAVVFDSYVTGAKVPVFVRARRLVAPPGRAAALYFEVSPRPFADPLWATLRAIGEGYRAGGAPPATPRRTNPGTTRTSP